MSRLKHGVFFLIWGTAWLAIAVFLVFLLFDYFPTLLGDRSWYVPYFASRRDYFPDSELVFRRRPTHRSFDYHGDQWTDAFAALGVPVPKMHFEETLNNEGFRQSEGATRADIAVLGDSYIEIGESESDTFSSRLQTESGQTTANYGIAWYGPYQYLQVFRRYAAPRHPKIALLCFFEGNDFTDIVQFRRWREGNPYYEFKVRAETPLWTRFAMAWHDVRGFLRPPRVLAPVLSHEALAAQLVDLEVGGKHITARWHYVPDTRAASEIIASTEGRALNEILDAFKALALGAGARPVVMFIPTPARIYAPYTTAASGAEWRSIRAASLRGLGNTESAVQTIAERSGLPFLDLVVPFRAAAADGQLLYYPFDTHWNPAGRRLAAQYVARQLSAGHPLRNLGR